MEPISLQVLLNQPTADINLWQQNKRQLVFGPPENYCGPRPPISCELYVTNLPMCLDIPSFLGWLDRLGRVFELRLMMNTVNETRGYCFVRFFDQKAAIAAFELLSFLFLNDKRPNAQISQCKRQLFVGGIPKSLSTNNVREFFRKVFGVHTKCIVYPDSENLNGVKNRGFVFLDFIEHDAALCAKKFLKYHRFWGKSLKVDWARQNEANTSPSEKPDSIAVLRKNDYSAKLRLYAIANNWNIPIICYGSNFKQNKIQYGGILLKDSKSTNHSCIVVEVVGDVFDIHVLLCEVATHLVEVFCGLPLKHFIVRARYGITAKILYSFVDISKLKLSILISKGLISITAAFDLMGSLEILAQYNSEVMLNFYKQSFRSESATTDHLAKFALIDDCKLSHFYSIYPKFRDNYPLNNHFNDTEIILLQAKATSYNGLYMNPDEFEVLMNAKQPDEGAFVLKSQRYNRHQNYVLSYVDVEMLKMCAFYHQTQQFNSPPLWVGGKTYQESIFELP